MKFEEVKTERLILRKMTAEDYQTIISTLPKERQMELLGFSTPTELEKEHERARGGYTTFNKKFLVFQILRAENPTVIGWCGYHTWYTDHDRAEIGYGLYTEAVKRKGYMGEALHAVLRYGFEEMKLHRVEAFVAAENKGSVRLLEKYKFKKEGVLRDHYRSKSNLEDSVVYGLLKDEFHPPF